MAAPSLYRRHRPRTFSDVVGQEPVVRTLRNAIERDRVHHAYLFVGSRGTGKTSMAKILAACLNCVQGPTSEPDGTCDSCVAIASATSLDVIEMDAASNNSVDDIRLLRESVAFAPVSGRSKVYILDEAHMLSTQAWNAFLKTLEEPPPDTVFVLATTEAQKVLPTVVDRCHRFDFQRPGAVQVAEVIRRVASTEQIAIPEEAIALVARNATGSFRDALGTLEQLQAYAGDSVGLDDVLAVLGLAGADLLLRAVDAVAAHDPAAALRVAAEMLESGRDAGQLLRDLESHAREILTVQLLGDVPVELRLTPERDERLSEQAARLGRTDAVRLLDLIAAAQEALRNGGEPRIQLELVLVKAAAPRVDPSTRALLARIDRLEAAVGEGGPVRAVAAPAPVSPPVPDPPAPAPIRPTPVAAAPGPAAAPEPSPAPGPVDLGPSPGDGAPATLDEVASLWPAVVEAIGPDNGMLAACVENARPVGVEDGELVVAFPAEASFFKKKADTQECRQLVVEAVRSLTGSTFSVRYEIGDAQGSAGPAPVATAVDPDEMVRRFMAEFDAEEITDDEEGP